MNLISRGPLRVSAAPIAAGRYFDVKRHAPPGARARRAARAIVVILRGRFCNYREGTGSRLLLPLLTYIAMCKPPPSITGGLCARVDAHPRSIIISLARASPSAHQRESDPSSMTARSGLRRLRTLTDARVRQDEYCRPR